MKSLRSILLSLALFFLILSPNAYAEEFTISLASPATSELVTLNIHFVFDQPTDIYHWRPRQSIYPILNSGLYIECHNVDNGAEVFFMPYEKFLPKLPHKLSILEVSQYQEELKLVPGRNYVYSSLNRGKYSLKLIYDTEQLCKYPGGKDLTLKRIESNEIIFQIGLEQ